MLLPVSRIKLFKTLDIQNSGFPYELISKLKIAFLDIVFWIINRASDPEK